MLDYNTWRVSHYLCLYAYLCLLIAAVIATVSTPSSFPKPEFNVRLPGGAPVLFVSRPSSTSDPESSRQLTGGGIAIVSSLLRDVHSNSLLNLILILQVSIFFFFLN